MNDGYWDRVNNQTFTDITPEDKTAADDELFKVIKEAQKKVGRYSDADADDDERRDND